MRIIEKPIVTEKSIALAKQNVYTFAVMAGTTTPEIAKAIESLYKVKVTDVRAISVHGQAVRRKTGMGKTARYKKALVTLAKGSKIAGFEFEEEKEKKKTKKDKE